MAWKIGGLKTNDDSPSGNGDKSGFHGVELFKKVASMPWKIAEFDFHAVELSAAQGETTTPMTRQAVSGGFCSFCKKFGGGEGRRFGRIWAETGKDAADAP